MKLIITLFTLITLVASMPSGSKMLSTMSMWAEKLTDPLVPRSALSSRTEFTSDMVSAMPVWAGGMKNHLASRGVLQSRTEFLSGRGEQMIHRRGSTSDPNLCMNKKALNCTCPDGWKYVQNATFMVLGAAWWDVYDIIGNWSDINWSLVPAIYINPGKNTRGAIRNISIPDTSKGQQTYTERITDIGWGGGEIVQFDWELTPVLPPSYNIYNSPSTANMVLYPTISAYMRLTNITTVEWYHFGCTQGNIWDFSPPREKAFNNLLKMLKDRNQNIKVPLGPYSMSYSI